jgi:hypothetical protein
MPKEIISCNNLSVKNSLSTDSFPKRSIPDLIPVSNSASANPSSSPRKRSFLKEYFVIS